MSDIPDNSYLSAPLGLTYAKTALPIIFVMGMNGLLSVADALFLGHYVGPDALAAVTLMFPIYMLIVALATLVSSGMSSVLARHLGGNRMSEAQAVFAGAHGLALLVATLLILLFFLFGPQFARLAAAGSVDLGQLGLTYLRITVLFSPLLFVLSVNSDTLRNEGRVGFMAAMSLLVSVANIGFNYVLIAHLDLGVAGSAYGTTLAQTLAFAIIVAFRLRGATHLRLSALKIHGLRQSWGRILALGAPQSLNFIGLSLGSAAIIAALQMVESPHYDHTVSAYGIITRVMTFAFLPLLGLSHAMQTITGNNYGAARWPRSNGSLRFALTAALLYCAVVQGVVAAFPAGIGRAFVDDAITVAEVARILPVMTLFFVISGPLMMIAMHFQAIGDARRAGLLGLAKPYLFALPLTFLLAAGFGETGVWAAGPVAELCLLVLTAFVLAITARRKSLRWGLFETVRKENMTIRLPSISEAKSQAGTLRQDLARHGTEIGHAQSLELVAHQHGFRDWNTFHAAIGNRPPAGWAPGGRVEGTYLSQPFKATVIASTMLRPGWFRLSLDLDEPVDVVSFDSFSNFRKRVHCVVGPSGTSHEKTSDGRPHVVLEQ